MAKAYYSAPITKFLSDSLKEIIGSLNSVWEFDREIEQELAWENEIGLLKKTLMSHQEWTNGHILLEYSIPRLCGRIDAVLLIWQTVFVLEFKIGEKKYDSNAKKQTLEYCLDLKYFHARSMSLSIVPVLIATKAKRDYVSDKVIWNDIKHISCCHDEKGLAQIITAHAADSGTQIDADDWIFSKYSPTPTIVEAAIALYEHHGVKDITKTSDDESATNLTKTSGAIRKIIDDAVKTHRKKICFVTGVPGAGKTLVGLNLATDRQISDEFGAKAVFLSGNKPLVDVLQHALQQDAKKRRKLISSLLANKTTIKPPPEVKQYFEFALKKTFIQDIFGFRKNYLDGGESDCKIAIFDEAQRCWTKRQMERKVKIKDIYSEAGCLIDQMNKNEDWAVIVCLIGGGQEINEGESGIVEWLKALNDHFQDWEAYISDELQKYPEMFDVAQKGAENKVAYQLKKLNDRGCFHVVPSLHLGVNLRSFRSEKVSSFANAVVENSLKEAKEILASINSEEYPIFLTRDLNKAKNWVREQSKRVDNLYLERFGVVASSNASRMRPEGIVVPKETMNVPKWMLGTELDVDSSYYLEVAASEFKIQGLEIDYALVIWEADYRYDMEAHAFGCSRFRGQKWQCVRNDTLRNYLKNAYRVLLTRARQGFIIYVPIGDAEDHTREPPFYAGTYHYLKAIGVKEL